MSRVPVRDVQVGCFPDTYVVVPAATDPEAIEKVRTLLGEWLAPSAVLKVVRVREEHETVGRRHRGSSIVRPPGASLECTCIAWDWRTGFWMRYDDGALHDVSERAIGRTYHVLRDEPR